MNHLEKGRTVREREREREKEREREEIAVGTRSRVLYKSFDVYKQA